jgi:hypothetical protein
LRNFQVAVRAFESGVTWAVLVVNPNEATQSEQMLLSDLVGVSQATVFEWLPGFVRRLGRRSVVAPVVQRHSAVLYYVSVEGSAPPPSLTLGGMCCS